MKLLNLCINISFYKNKLFLYIYKTLVIDLLCSIPLLDTNTIKWIVNHNEGCMKNGQTPVFFNSWSENGKKTGLAGSGRYCEWVGWVGVRVWECEPPNDLHSSWTPVQLSRVRVHPLRTVRNTVETEHKVNSPECVCVRGEVRRWLWVVVLF